MRAWYHCDDCGAGFAPRDRELGLDGTALSPAALRMTGVAAGLNDTLDALRTHADSSDDARRCIAR